MKKILAMILIAVMMIPSSVSAAGFGGLSSAKKNLPDPGDITGSEGVFYSDEFVLENGMTYTAYVFAIPDDPDAFIDAYAALAEDEGYTVGKANISGMKGWSLTASVGQSAYLIYPYLGSMLLLVPGTIPYVPEPTPTPKPQPTPNPNAGSYDGYDSYDSYGGSHLETIEVKQSCFACHSSGRCSLCNGSGVYRMYGSSVPCSTICETCDGLGYWYTTQVIYTPY